MTKYTCYAALLYLCLPQLKQVLNGVRSIPVVGRNLLLNQEASDMDFPTDKCLKLLLKLLGIFQDGCQAGLQFILTTDKTGLFGVFAKFQDQVP